VTRCRSAKRWIHPRRHYSPAERVLGRLIRRTRRVRSRRPLAGSADFCLLGNPSGDRSTTSQLHAFRPEEPTEEPMDRVRKHRSATSGACRIAANRLLRIRRSARQ
jgi:hypothetical protein